MANPRLPRRAPARSGFLAFVVAGPMAWGAVAPARAEAAAPACEVTYEQAAKAGRAAAAADSASVFTDYDGEEAAKLVAAINAQPPVTAYPAEHILAVENPDEAMIALIHNGCLTEAFMAPHGAWAALRHGAIGEPS